MQKKRKSTLIFSLKGSVELLFSMMSRFIRLTGHLWFITYHYMLDYSLLIYFNSLVWSWEVIKVVKSKLIFWVHLVSDHRQNEIFNVLLITGLMRQTASSESDILLSLLSGHWKSYICLSANENHIALLFRYLM